ncbi:aromatic aminotransferase [Colletotrichum sojae]|uniref:Aromatic aminotransferase n=1 Tax=Colletotrichum sojae TaxID=2175907 RepID=A0A8H6MPS5_9PEZI|nr:aromatic aminotransferase [Colletotrichum sojae]
MGSSAQQREPQPTTVALKAASRGPAQKKLISLGTAIPAPDYFSWESMMLECMQNATTEKEGASKTTTTTTATKGKSAYDLAVAMNDRYSAGSSQALRFITEHVELYTYSGTIMAAKAQSLRLLGIEMDDLGLLPDALDRALQNWDCGRGRKPFVLYMIPTGQNPTGTTQSLERRKAIYDVAESLVYGLLVSDVGVC